MKTPQKAISETLGRLRERYPAKGALDLGSTFQFLVAVVLSARTRDEQVLKALPELYRNFPTPRKLADADEPEIAKTIKTIGFYRAKAKFIKKLAQEICDRFDGEVPETMEGLTTLPGVGRKTASVILAARFGVPAIAVDTHVFRIVQRLGWVKGSSVLEVEKKLLDVVPETDKTTVNTVMVPFGREICIPGTPRCWACPVADLCAYSRKNLDVPKNADVILAKAQAQKDEIVRLQHQV